MKNLIYFLFILFILFSCKKEFVLDKQQGEKLISINSLKSATTSDLDFTGIPVYIKLPSGISTSNQFLSAFPDGKMLNIYGTDDLSGRQRWVLSNSVDAGYYNISVMGGISSTRRYLSSYPNGTTVDLWTSDEGSGRQRWSLVDIGNGLYNIKIKDGCVSGGRKYLSSYPDGSKVDLFTAADYTGRQNWKLEPAGDFELINITYYLEPQDGVIPKPDIITYQYQTNGTANPATFTFSYQQSQTWTSEFKKTLGLSLKISESVTAHIPTLLDGTISTEILSTSLWAYGTTDAKTTTFTYTFTGTFQPYQTLRAKFMTSINELNVHYEATYRSNLNGAEKKVIGLWSGVQSTYFSYEVSDATTGTMVTKSAKIPIVQ